MDEKTMASYASQFMGRVQLQGAEVPAFNAVMAWLESKSTQAGQEEGADVQDDR